MSNKFVSESRALHQTIQRKKELWKTVRLTSVKKPQLQSVSIFFKFVHPYLLLYFQCYLHLHLTFWEVIFLFHLILLSKSSTACLLVCLPTKHLGVNMNSFKRVRAFQIELEFGSVGLWGEGKTEVPGEKPLRARERTNNKLNPHKASTPEVESVPHWWEATAFTTAPSLASTPADWSRITCSLRATS